MIDFYSKALALLNLYQATETEELKQDMREKLHELKGRELAKRAGIPVETLYLYTKNNGKRPSYEVYIRVMAVSKDNETVLTERRRHHTKRAIKHNNDGKEE